MTPIAPDGTRGLLGDRGARPRFRAGAFCTLALALAGCSAQTTAVAPPAASAATWGDRTVAVVAAKAEPTLAYFAPGQGAGVLYVWDSGEDAIVRGDWRLDGTGRVCASLDAFHRASSGGGALRAARPACLDPEGGAMARASYRGDVFQLSGKSEAPYILSAADNERLAAVLDEARRTSP